MKRSISVLLVLMFLFPASALADLRRGDRGEEVRELRLIDRVRRAVPRCQFVLLCDENSDPELAQSVKRARQDRLIDAFLYASVTPAYLTAALDAL